MIAICRRLLVAAPILAATLGVGVIRGDGAREKRPAGAPAGEVKAMTRPASRLPIEREIPPFDGAGAWINSPPLSPEGLRGRVVLVDFWTYTCVNWLRTLPYVRAWAAKYGDRGLVVIGAHTPEFSVEHDPANVRRAVSDMRIEYPVAVDSEYAVWRAFDNAYWPAVYVADAQGRIRYHHFGEGEYQETERVIQELLEESGATGVPRDLVKADARGTEVAADWSRVKSSETYVGSEKTENFASPEGAAGTPHVYAVPATLALNRWGLAGEWTVGPEIAAAGKPRARIAYRFHARDVNLVMGPGRRGQPVRFRVEIDGHPPGAAHGTDTDEDGAGSASWPRLYQLIRQPRPIRDRLFEIEFLDPGIEAFVFTFG
jgi:thiol-disulfide isomerase/thioredoxin